MTTAPAGADRHPLAPCLDLFVFAPIGLVVQARRHLPSLIEAGRHQAHTQVKVARMVGEFAVNFGRRELEKWVGARLAPTPTTPPEVAERAIEATAAVVPLRPRAGDATTAAQLPITGYDSLAASQVVERLTSLSPAELAQIRVYETAHRHRRTVLHRIEQLEV